MAKLAESEATMDGVSFLLKQGRLEAWVRKELNLPEMLEARVLHAFIKAAETTAGGEGRESAPEAAEATATTGENVFMRGLASSLRWKTITQRWSRPSTAAGLWRSGRRWTARTGLRTRSSQ